MCWQVMYHVQVASMSTHRMCRVAGAQPVNLVDPRLGKYLLNPDIPDADLELSALVGMSIAQLQCGEFVC